MTEYKQHKHHFKDDGINVNYCTFRFENSNTVCPFEKDKKTGKIGKFVIYHGQGIILDSTLPTSKSIVEKKE